MDVIPCSLVAIAASFCMVKGSQMTSYLLVLVARSSRVLVVIIIAVFFTQVKNPKFKITKDKLWWGFILMIGIFIFFSE